MECFQYEKMLEPWHDLVYGEILDGSTEEAREGDFVSWFGFIFRVCGRETVFVKWFGVLLHVSS